MKVPTLCLGLAVGFAFGWLVFGTGVTPPPTPVAPPPVDSRVKVSVESESPVERGVPTPGELVSALRSGLPGRYQSILEEPGRRWTAAEVRALIEWVDRARADGNSNSFRSALRWLAAAKTPAAQRKLLDLMADETLHPPFRLGGYFHEGLAGSDLPGVAAAARKRFEKNVASGNTSWTAGHGYFELVAATGTPEDMEWLVASAEQGVGRRQAREALAKSKRPDAIAYTVRLIEDGKADQDFLTVFARHQPETGAGLLRRIISGEIDANYRELSAIFGAYGSCVSPDEIAEARAFLTSFRKPMWEVTAVYAVEQLRRRGLDLSGLEPVIAAPAAFLEQVTPDGDMAVASKARYAIEYNRVAWSSRAAAALERAAETLPESSLTKSMVEIALEVRVGLESHWK